MYPYHGIATLPTGKTMNPSNPDDAFYFDPGQVAYVIKNDDTGKLAVFTSFGHLGSDFDLGKVNEHRHDQTFRSLGWFKVIGIVEFKENGVALGEIPNRKIKHWVCK